MTLTQKQMRMIPQLKTELTYSKVEHLLSQYYEDQLAKEVSKIFQEMEYRVINNLAEYYNPEVMFKAHTDLILAPIHEMHKQYYELLCKYKIREFDKSRASGKRIVERLINFRRKGNVLNRKYTVLKADLNDAVSSTITKDKLFGTSPDVHENLETRTYQLSEKTLARVDGQINDIIVNGYEEGMGIDKVSRDIRRRFGQLKTWESVRIARTEIHNSQYLGVIKGYDDMGVEYIQWSTARDSRVRGLKPKDSADHIHMEGEIIRMGGVFSNGLMYPGDMNGPAAEIINCRCQALPFIIPYGYIAPPDMAQFREDDLIATLDSFNADELLSQAMAETTEAIPHVEGYNKYVLNESQQTLLNELKSQGELKFLDKIKLKKLEQQIRFNELNNQLLTEGKLEHDLAKEYFSLQHSIDDKLEQLGHEFKHLDDIAGIVKKPKPTVTVPKDLPDEPERITWPKTTEVNGKKYTNFSDDPNIIEDKQIALQKKAPWDEEHIGVVHDYGYDGHKDINGVLFDEPDILSGLKTRKQIDDDIYDLTEAIDIGPRLQENTTVFRGGVIPEGLKPGDEFVVEGFQSYSFDLDVAIDFKEESAERFLITTHAEKGSKGVHIDDEMFQGLSEDEWLMQRGQKHKVINVDYENKTLETELINDW